MLHLGIIEVDGVILNHRSLLKIVANPFLRVAGWQIVSEVDIRTIIPMLERTILIPYQFCRISFRKCKKRQPNLLKNLAASWLYKLPVGAVVHKKRTIL